MRMEYEAYGRTFHTACHLREVCSRICGIYTRLKQKRQCNCTGAFVKGEHPRRLLCNLYGDYHVLNIHWHHLLHH